MSWVRNTAHPQVLDGVRLADHASGEPDPVPGGAVPAALPPLPHHLQDCCHVRQWSGPACRHGRGNQRLPRHVPGKTVLCLQ
jgi:hypothetical protein